MNTGTKVTTEAIATTHDKIELPEPAFVAGTKIGTTVGFFCKDSRIKKGDGAYTREQVIAAIEADRKRRGEPSDDLRDLLDEAYAELLADSHRDGPRCLLLTRIEAALAAPQSGEPVAYVSGGFRRIYNGPGDWYNVGTIILCDDSPEATLPAGTNLYAAPQIPEGYKLVPIEPTEDMINAAIQDGISVDGKPVWKHNVAFQAKWRYQAMLEAAPEVKVDAEASVPSDTDIDELSREWGLASAAYPSKSMVRDFSRALLARYK